MEKKKELMNGGAESRYEHAKEALRSSLQEMNKKDMFESPPKRGDSLFCGVIGKTVEKVPHTVTNTTSDSEEKSAAMTKTSEFGSQPETIDFYALGEGVCNSELVAVSKQKLSLEVMYGAIDETRGAATDQDISNPKFIDYEGLPYAREEFAILTCTEVGNDVRAGIIWHAVEREQIRGEVQRPRLTAPSSDEILGWLYNSRVFGDTTVPLSSRKTYLSDDDAIIIHAVDAVTSHYMKDLNKVDPFNFSKFSLDTSILEMTSIPLHYQEYFNSVISESVRVSTMKVGHKIASSLLTWASHMHLNSRSRKRSKCKLDSILDDPDSIDLASDIEFVGEVMRLIAARWREAAEMNGETIETRKQPEERERKKPGPKPGVKRATTGTKPVSKTKEPKPPSWKRPAHWKKPGPKRKKKEEVW